MVWFEEFIYGGMINLYRLVWGIHIGCYEEFIYGGMKNSYLFYNDSQAILFSEWVNCYIINNSPNVRMFIIDY